MTKVSHLRRTRILASLSLYDVSPAVGISVPDLSLAERGLKKLRPDQKAKLADFFRRPVEALFDEEETLR